MTTLIKHRFTGLFAPALEPTPLTLSISHRIESRGIKSDLDGFKYAVAFIHRNIHYETDYVQYGVKDVFNTPDQTLRNRNADCEDMAMAVIAIVNGYQPRHRPKEIYMTIGYYELNPLIRPGGYHAWAYAKMHNRNEYIGDATVGWVVNNKSEIGRRYHPVLGVYPRKLVIFKDIGSVI